MKYMAVLNTDDYKDFEFFEDGNGKYMVAKDAGATVDGGWMPLYFTEYKQEPCEDVISRYEVIDLLKGNIEWLYKDCNVYSKLPKWKQKIIDINEGIIGQINKSIKPITPQQKTGHWIINKEKTLARCSNCKFLLKAKDEIQLFDTFVQGYNYCPYCGTKIAESHV